jgi:signal transduction histidine kinase
MLPYWTAPLAAALGNLVIGLGVLWTARGQRLHRAFAVLTTTLFLWNLDVFCLYFFDRAEDALYWSRFFRPGMFLVPAALYHFAATFRERSSVLSTGLVLGGYAAGAIFIVADFCGVMIGGLRHLYSGYWPVMRPLYNAFIALLLLSFVAFLASLVEEYRTTPSPRRRVRAKFWLLGAVIALPLASVNLLPFFRIDVYPVGSLGNLVCTGIFAYAIVHHRLVETDIVITKGVAFLAGTVLVIAPLCLLSSWLDQAIFGTPDYNRALLSVMILLGAAVAFPRIAGITEERLSQTLFREKVEHRRALAAFSRHAAQIRDPEESLRQLGDVIRTGVGVDSVTILLGSDAGYRTEPDVGGDADLSIAGDDPLVAALRTCDDVLVREELVVRGEGGADAASSLERLGSEAAVPLRAKGCLLGCVLIGGKINRDAFSREDLQLLWTLGNSTAIALDNARLSNELKTSQHMVARASRLSAVGTLAAGIAHEIRNPLVAVQTFVQLLPERLDDAEFVQSFRQLSLSEIGRIGRLIEELLSLARSTVHAPAPCDLRALVADVVTLLEPQARRSKLTLRLVGDPVPAVWVDAARIKQVFMNLILNAIEASPPETEVLVTLLAGRRLNGEPVCRVKVRDQGRGIPHDRREDVFTPFFTTKDFGTGLGLAVAHQIATEHGGAISFTSERDVGTTFVVSLPACDVSEGGTAGTDETRAGPVADTAV